MEDVTKQRQYLADLRDRKEFDDEDEMMEEEMNRDEVHFLHYWSILFFYFLKISFPGT